MDTIEDGGLVEMSSYEDSDEDIPVNNQRRISAVNMMRSLS